MSKTNTGLVAYVKDKIDHPYWYGCFGQISTKALYNSKKNQYPKQYQWECKNNQSGTTPAKQLGVRVFDCIGLIKAYLWTDSLDGSPKYKASQDVSANGMRDKCVKKGTIGSMPDVAGILVFMDGHIGVYIGNGKVVEAKGHKYGVVETNLKGRGWTHWGYCPWITYETKPTTTTPTPAPSTTKKTVDEIAKEVIEGKWGNGDERKKKLTAAGYDYSAVQKRVNELTSSTSTSKKKSVTEIAKEVIEGKWGNGLTRRLKLAKAGYNPSEVQKEVNRLLK